MVDSNYSGFSGGSYYWNGNKVTKARFDYELTRQQERILAEVNKLATDQATSAVSIGAGFDQQEFGGLLRQIMPNLLDEFGQINSTAALDFYQQQANAYWEANKANPAGLSRDARRSRETNFARARTRSAIGLNTNQDKYVALLADNYDTAAKSERVIGWTMKVRAKDGHQAAVGAMNNAITREVASYHRDTVLFNAALDPYVSRVQRVAQASACEFCRLMAIGSTNGRVRVSSYAVKFHDHCHCTIQPLFEGEEPIRPDYYDEFESEYTQAKSEWNGSNAGTKQTLANWREIQKAKANGTYVEESQTRWQRIEDTLKQSPYYKGTQPEYLKFVQAPQRAYQTIEDLYADQANWKNLGISNTFKPGQAPAEGDQMLSYVLKKQGMDGKPEIVGSIEELGENPLFRGVGNPKDKATAISQVAQFKFGDESYQGLGYFGNGTYFATGRTGATIPSYRIAGEYAGLGDAYFDQLSLDQVLNSGQVIAAQWKPEAKVLKFANEQAQLDWLEERVAKLPGEWTGSWDQAKSVLAAVEGYDGILMEHNGFVVVLNRGATKVLG
jgi:hypothetical protein